MTLTVLPAESSSASERFLVEAVVEAGAILGAA